MTISTVVPLVALLTTIWGVIVWLIPRAKAISDLLDDWRGEAERPGVPARPGVMERLTEIENKIATCDPRSLEVNSMIREMYNEMKGKK